MVLGELLAAAIGSVGVRQVGASRLAALAPGDLVRLDDNARTGWPWAAPSWTELPAGSPALAENTGIVAAMASMHPDGRIRQTAVRTLAGRPGRLPAALLALRSVDHVSQIRADATTGLAGHASVEEAHAALPVLLAVAARMHGLPTLGRYAGELMNRHGGVRVMLALLDSDDRRTRRWAFTSCLDGGLFTVAELLAAAQDRHDQVIRRAAADALEHRHPDPAALRALLTGRYADGRVAALAALPDAELSDADLRAALLDRSPRVRDTARWRARRRGLDVVGLYRQVLSAGDTRPALVAAALLGLVWVGSRDDLPAITRRLADPHPRVRAAAVRALIARTEPGEVTDRVAGLLLDVSPPVTVAAARALAAAAPATTQEAEDAAWASAQPWSRRAAWHIGRARGGWDRVEADLRAAADSDPEVAALGRTSLDNWLRTAAATTWQPLRGPQADRLGRLLPAASLDHDMHRLIAFHAGLSGPPDRSEAAPMQRTPELTVVNRRLFGWFGRRPR